MRLVSAIAIVCCGFLLAGGTASRGAGAAGVPPVCGAAPCCDVTTLPSGGGPACCATPGPAALVPETRAASLVDESSSDSDPAFGGIALEIPAEEANSPRTLPAPVLAGSSRLAWLCVWRK